MSSKKSSDNIALLDAVRRGETKKVRRLLEKGADPNYNPSPFESLFDLASENTEIIKLLVQYGAEVRGLLKSIFEEPSFFNDSTEIVIHIIKCVKDVTVKRDIFIKLVTKWRAPEILVALLDHGFGVNDYLIGAAYTPFIYSVLRNRYDLYSIMLKRGADVNKKDVQGRTCLYLLASEPFAWNELTVRTLLEHGANVNAKMSKEHYGKTVLHAACLHQKAKDVRLLLKYGADINIVDKHGKTPLTAMGFEPELKKTLLKHLAMMSLKDQTICDENLQFVLKNEDLLNIYEECVIELNEMKEIEIYHGITMFDIFLVEHDCMKLFSLAKDERFAAAFKSSWNRESFKYYAEDVEKIAKKAVHIKNVIQSEERRLRLIFDDCLPSKVIQKLAFFSHDYYFSKE